MKYAHFHHQASAKIISLQSVGTSIVWASNEKKNKPKISEEESEK